MCTYTVFTVHKVFLHMALYGAEPDFSGSVGGAEVCKPTCKLVTFFSYLIGPEMLHPGPTELKSLNKN